MLKLRYACKECGKRLSLSTAWIDNNGALCREHAKELMLDRYGSNHQLIGNVKAIELKKMREA